MKRQATDEGQVYTVKQGSGKPNRPEPWTDRLSIPTGEYEKLATARHNRRSAQAWAIAVVWAVGLILIVTLLIAGLQYGADVGGVIAVGVVALLAGALFGAAMIQGVK